jgi:hypothetical protein
MLGDKFWRWFDRGSRADFGGTLLGFFFDWKTAISTTFGGSGGAVTLLVTAIQGRPFIDVCILAIAAAAALVALVYFSISLLEKLKNGRVSKLPDTLTTVAKGTLPALDRIPITELLKMATDRGWNFTANDSLHLLDLQDAIKQGASDGHLTLWGRLRRWNTESLLRNEVLEKISPDYWRTFYVHLWPACDSDNFHTKSWNPDDKLQNYLDLHVNRPEAVIWLDRDAAAFRGKRKPDQRGMP